MLTNTAVSTGTVSAIAAHAGETAQPGMPLLTITALGQVHVEALAAARIVRRLHVGMTAQARQEAKSGGKLALILDRISPTAEPDGRTFRIWFKTAPGAALSPGEAVRIVIGAAR